MKADQMGTPTEQARYRMGWMTAPQRRAAGNATRCDTCAHFTIDFPTVRGGGIRTVIRCRHPMATGKEGMATREAATCEKWERRP